jgi:hypothetical protein
MMLTWQRQVATCDWAGDTGVDLDMWHMFEMWRCHVAPRRWMVALCKNYVTHANIPRDLLIGERTYGQAQHYSAKGRTCVYKPTPIYLRWIAPYERRNGLGPSPSPRHTM